MGVELWSPLSPVYTSDKDRPFWNLFVAKIADHTERLPQSPRMRGRIFYVRPSAGCGLCVRAAS